MAENREERPLLRNIWHVLHLANVFGSSQCVFLNDQICVVLFFD